MASTIANIIGFAGGLALIAALIYMMAKGSPEREEEEQARRVLDEHGHWPDEAPTPPRAS